MNKKNIVGIGIISASLMGLRYVPFSFIIGSWSSFFSYTNLVGPLATYFGGVAGLCVYSLLKLYLCKTAAIVSLLINTLPGVCANLYWLMPFAISVVVPVLSFVLFMVHPVGMYAFVYALLWAIPVTIYVVRPKAFFFKALSATFAAHAVGSVLWLYLMPSMTPMSWIMLTPIALCERIIFAASMSLVRLIVYAAATLVNRCAVHIRRWAM